MLLNSHLVKALLVASVMLCSCDRNSLEEKAADRIQYIEVKDQQRIKKALSNAKIPYEVHKGQNKKDEIWYDLRFRKEVAKIKIQTFGETPPMGRSISMDPADMPSFEKDLTAQNIAFQKVRFHDTEFITWDPISDVAMDNLLQSLYSKHPEFLTNLQEMRRYADSEHSSLTHN